MRATLFGVTMMAGIITKGAPMTLLSFVSIFHFLLHDNYSLKLHFAILLCSNKFIKLIITQKL